MPGRTHLRGLSLQNTKNGTTYTNVNDGRAGNNINKNIIWVFVDVYYPGMLLSP